MRRKHKMPLDGPAHFRARWLAFDEQRPTRWRLAMRFTLAVLLSLAAAAVLAVRLGR